MAAYHATSQAICGKIDGPETAEAPAKVLKRPAGV